jgi:predicted protein tyrosine phosphatase
MASPAALPGSPGAYTQERNALNAPVSRTSSAEFFLAEGDEAGAPPEASWRERQLDFAKPAHLTLECGRPAPLLVREPPALGGPDGDGAVEWEDADEADALQDTPAAAALAERLRKLRASETLCHVGAHVYVGSESAAANVELLRGAAITHVVCCAREAGALAEGAARAAGLALHRLRIDADDSRSLLLLQRHVPRLWAWLLQTGGFEPGARVLLHCNQGRNRSVALAVALVALRTGEAAGDVCERVLRTRPSALVNDSFVAQLAQLDTPEGRATLLAAVSKTA